MTIIDDDEKPSYIPRRDLELPTKQEYSLTEQFSALWQDSDPFGSEALGEAVYKYQNRPEPVNNFNPFDGTHDLRIGYEENYIDAESPWDVDYINQKIDKELQNKEIAGSAPLWLGLSVGIVDPANLLPFNVFRKAGMATKGIARTAGEVAVTGAGVAGVREVFLQNTQETRTAEESALNMVSAGLIAGVLGGAGSALSKRAEFDMSKLHKDTTDLIRQNEGNSVGAARVSDIDIDDLEFKAREKFAAEGLQGVDLENAISKNVAEQVVALEGLANSLGVGEKLSFQDPVMRMLNSSTKEARKIVAKMANIGSYQAKNMEGYATEVPIETAVIKYDANVAEYSQGLNDLYLQYRGVTPSRGAMLKTLAKDKLTGGRPAGTLSKEQFVEAVSYANRRGDKHEIPQVAEAAALMRSKVINPLAVEAQRVGLLPMDLDVKTAESYLMRRYHKGKILNNPIEFDNRSKAYMIEERDAAVSRLEHANILSEKLRGMLKTERGNLLRTENATSRLVPNARQKLNMKQREVDLRAQHLKNYEYQLKRINERMNKFKPDDIDEGYWNELLDGVKNGGSKELRALIKQKRAELPNWRAMERASKQSVKEMKEQRRLQGDSLLQFISKRGGVVDGGGELKDMDAGLWHKGKPFRRKLIREGEEKNATVDMFGEKITGDFGMYGADEVTYAAWEAGYLGGAERPTQEALFEAIRRELSGKPVYKMDAEYNPSAIEGEYFDVGKFEHDYSFERHELASHYGIETEGKTLEEIDEEIIEFEARVELAQRAKGEDLSENELLAESEDINYKQDYIDFLTNVLPDGGRNMSATDLRDFVDNYYRHLDGQEDRKYVISSPATRARYKEMVYQQDKIAYKIEQAEAAWSKASAQKLKLADELLQKQEIKGMKASEIKEMRANLKELTKDVNKLANDIAQDKWRASFFDEDFDQVAIELRERILGSPFGRLDYSYKTGEKMRMGGRNPMIGASGSLKARVWGIPDANIEDFLVNDSEMLAASYVRQMASQIALYDKFGSISMEQQVREITDAYQKLIYANPAKAKDLKLEQDSVLKDMKALRDRLLGTYQMDDYSTNTARTVRVIKQLNYMRLLGGITLSSIPDIARPVMVHGVSRVFGTGIKGLITNSDAFKRAANEIKEAGNALDIVLNTVAMARADLSEPIDAGSKLEMFMSRRSNEFSALSLMNHWNAAGKQFSGVVAQSRIIQDIKKLVDGTIDVRDQAWLAHNFIDANNGKQILEQFEKHGEISGDIYIPNAREWDVNVRNLFRDAINKTLNNTIVTQGIDKPLWFDNGILKLAAQFRGFGFAATQRVLISGLQTRDMQTLNGVALMVGLGAMTYMIKETIAGREYSTDPMKLIIEGVDKSGVTGWLIEPNNITEKLTRGKVGLSALTGDEPMSRYASRGVMGAVAGPTVGLIEDAANFIGGVTSGAPTAAEIRSGRALLPYQNSIAFRWLFDEAEKNINSTIGNEEKTK